MKYNDYSELDFLKDDFFIKWIINPDPETNDFWNRWMKNHPDKFRQLMKAKELINSLHLKEYYRIDEADYDQLFENIMLYQQKRIDREFLLFSSNNNSHDLKKWLVAATVTFIFILSSVFVIYINQPVNESVEEAVTEMTTKVVPAGVKYTIKLEDGTLVKLNSGTRITYPEYFSDSSRIVHLNGEAFFEVKRDSTRPFIIKTKNFQTEVLGTSFNIKAYKKADEGRIAVVSGSVKIKDNYGNSQVLAPYEMGIIEDENESILKDHFDVKKEVGWKDGILLFEKATFQEIIGTLTLWYGVEFKVDSNVKISGVFSGEYRNEALEDVLNGIAFSSEFNFRIEDKSVFIYN